MGHTVYKARIHAYHPTMQLQSGCLLHPLRAEREPAGVEQTGADQTSANGKALPRLYMTSDLRAATGLSRTHLDYYLREGLIRPAARTESGYLLFDDRELETLRLVIARRQAGASLREIRLEIGREP